MASVRLVADEMLGRLARYLRMLGVDTVYVQGYDDDRILAEAREEGRTVVTRDRQLAERASGSVLLRSLDLPGQLRELDAALPGLPRAVSFDRCTECNGVLRPESPRTLSEEAIRTTARSPVPVFVCAGCGHRYWEGSHTSAVRRHVAEWLGEAVT